MITIYRIPTPKAELAAMEPLEREFFIVAGHLLNEINCFGKILHLANNAEQKPDPLDKAYLANAFSTYKLMAAKLYESRETIRKLYQETELAKRLQGEISEEGKNAIKVLNKYFSSSNNALSIIRNAYSFHYDYARLNKAFSDINDGEDWSIYLSDSNANSLYYVSELIVNKSLLSEINKSDAKAAMSRIFEDVNLVWGSTVTFLSACMIALNERFSTMKKAENIDYVNIAAPNLKDMYLAYFVDDQRS